MLQENPLLIETDLYEIDDPVLKQNSNTSHELHTLISEKQNQNFNDIHLSQDILFNITNSTSNIITHNNTNTITQTPVKPTSIDSLPFFDPSFFAQCKVFENFILPSDTILTLPILPQAQKDDPVLSTVNKWLNQKQRPHSLTPIVETNSFLYTYYRQFQHLYIDPTLHLIQYYTPNSRIFEEVFI